MVTRDGKPGHVGNARPVLSPCCPGKSPNVTTLRVRRGGRGESNENQAAVAWVNVLGLVFDLVGAAILS
jgi:hypothetical protein